MFPIKWLLSNSVWSTGKDNVQNHTNLSVSVRSQTQPLRETDVWRRRRVHLKSLACGRATVQLDMLPSDICSIWPPHRCPPPSAFGHQEEDETKEISEKIGTSSNSTGRDGSCEKAKGEPCEGHRSRVQGVHEVGQPEEIRGLLDAPVKRREAELKGKCIWGAEREEREGKTSLSAACEKRAREPEICSGTPSRISSIQTRTNSFWTATCIKLHSFHHSSFLGESVSEPDPPLVVHSASNVPNGTSSFRALSEFPARKSQSTWLLH